MSASTLFSAPLNKFLILLLFITACLIIYHNTFGHAFILYDDLTYINAIKENDAGLWSLIIWAFSGTVNVNWHPITLLSFIADYKLFGENAGGYHATSLAIHLANSFLVFLVFHVLSRKQAYGLLVALFFLIHPLNVEAVSWVAERKGVLGAFFTLTAIYFFLQFRITTKRIYYAASLASFLAALLSKAAFVTLPILLIIIELYLVIIDERKISKKDFQAIIITQLPFFILALAIGIITVYVHSNAGALITDKLYPLETRLAKSIAFYPIYIFQLLYPFDLHLSYPYRAPTTLELWTGILSLTVLTVIAILFRKKTPAIFLGWMWYVILLFPVSGIIQSGSHLHADRYAYLPIVGIIFLIIAVMVKLLSRFNIRQRTYLVVISLLVPILVIISWNQHRTWKNSFSVFYNTYSYDQKNVFANTFLSKLYLQAGNIEEGMRFYSQGRESDASFLYLYDSTYDELILQQKPDIALTVLQDALNAVSDLNVSGGSRYSSYRDLYLLRIAATYISLKQYQSANETLEKSIIINPNNYEFKFLYGYTKYLQGDFLSAESFLLEVLNSQPEHFQTVYLLIKTYRDWGKPQVAKKYIANALSNFPQHEEQIRQLAATID